MIKIILGILASITSSMAGELDDVPNPMFRPCGGEKEASQRHSFDVAFKYLAAPYQFQLAVIERYDYKALDRNLYQVRPDHRHSINDVDILLAQYDAPVPKPILHLANCLKSGVSMDEAVSARSCFFLGKAPPETDDGRAPDLPKDPIIIPPPARTPHDAFLKILKNTRSEILQLGGKAEIFNLAAHGTRCRDPHHPASVHWCAAIPNLLSTLDWTLKLKRPQPFLNTKKFQMMALDLPNSSPGEGWSDNTNPAADLVSDLEIQEILSPRVLTLDSCFSGHCVAMEKTLKSKGMGLFLLGATLPGKMAKADNFTEQWAELLMKNPCAFDLDHDGMITERELSLGILISYVGPAHYGMTVREMRDWFRKQVNQGRSKPNPGPTTNPSHLDSFGLPTLTPGNRCVARLSAACPSQSVQGSSCKQLQERLSKISLSVDQWKNGDISKSEETVGRLNDKHWNILKDESRKQSAAFLEEWIGGLEKTVGQCIAAASSARGACDYSPTLLDSSLKSFKVWSREFEEVLQWESERSITD